MHRTRRYPRLCAVVLASTLLSSATRAQLNPRTPADLVIKGGRIITLDEARPEVSALAVLGDRILALGGYEDVKIHVGDDTRILDMEGLFVTPGWIEGHGHFLGIGDAAQQLDLMGVRSWNEVVDLVEDAVKRARPGEVIRGRGWHQEKWAEVPIGAVEGLPTHHSLSEVSPDNPVILRHASGHATFANKKAMEICGIGEDTADPDGGQLVRDSFGLPIGVFRETAASLLRRAEMNAPPPDLKRLVELADRECLSKGITSFQDAGTSLGMARELGELADTGVLETRVWMMIRAGKEQLARDIPTLGRRKYGAGMLTIGGIKHSLDGALGSHGAWLLEPYADMPDSSGLNTVSIETVEASANLCVEHDLQLCIHAIGDRANREVLDIFEATFERLGDGVARRWRIEHSQHLHPDDIPRFGELGVVASMQGIHCTSDAPWVLRRLGPERAESGAYMWRALIDSGALVTNGSDAPVEDVDPLASFHASVTRRLQDGTRFFPEQCMTRMEALRSYTVNCAMAAFEEDIKGTLAVGKYADLTVFDTDLLACEEEELLEAEVAYTIVGGQVLYAR